MPHFVMECSAPLLQQQKESCILKQLHNTAFATGLFVESEIKVRINAFEQFSVGNQPVDFIHVFAHIMQGRSVEQKAKLSEQIVEALAALFPNTQQIAMSVTDFEKA